MSRTSTRAFALAALLVAVAVPGFAQDRLALLAQIPDPGVPQRMTMEGTFVRASYNDEGWVSLGYRAANDSVGEPWMVLDVGIALRDVRKAEQITRDQVSLNTPDGRTLRLPSNEEYLGANLSSLDYRASGADHLTFPGETEDVVNRASHGGTFFHDFSDYDVRHDHSVRPPLDGVTLSPRSRWAGRVYFPVEGGIAYGQYWLNVHFAGGVIRVPFRIMTRDEERAFRKNYDTIKKQLKAASETKKY
jgi:hypothetical protein